LRKINYSLNELNGGFMKILVIEDELQIRELLKDNLEYEGYNVVMAEDGEDGLYKAQNENPDLIILDLMIPKLHGFDLLKKFRKFNSITPIIILSAKSEEIDKIKGLDLGADDYMTKPFQIRELLSRIRAIFRRVENSAEAIIDFAFEDFKIDFQKGILFQGDKKLEISYYEFEILRYLILNRNKPVTRDEIISSIWKAEGAISSRNIDTHIVSLRKIIEKDPANPKYLKTVFRIGYKFEI